MSDLAVTVVSGVLTGGVWALLALAFVVVFRGTDVFNFATPQIGTVGAYVGLVALAGLVPAPVAGLVAVLVAAALSLGVERFLIRPLGPGALFPAVVVTFGLALVLESVIDWVWGHAPRPTRPLVEGTVDVLSLTLSWQRIVTFGLALIVLAAVAAFFRLTRTGVAMLAAAADPGAAQVVGIDTRRLGQYAWALGGGLAGLAAYLLAGQAYLTVTLLAAATVRAFAGMFLGGLSSMVGVVVGGVLIGVLENLVSRYVSVEFSTTALFGVMLVILLVRPAGLFGSRTAVRV